MEIAVTFESRLAHGLFKPLAEQEEPPVQRGYRGVRRGGRRAGCGSDGRGGFSRIDGHEENLAHYGFGSPGYQADHGGVGGDVAPGKDLQPGDGGDFFVIFHDGSGGFLHTLPGKEHQTRAVGTGFAQGGNEFLVEAVRYLEEHAGAVAGLVVGAFGSAVLHALQDFQSPFQDGVRRASFDVGYEAYSAGIVLVFPSIKQTIARLRPVIALVVAHCGSLSGN